MFIEPRNRFQGINFVSLCGLAGWYDDSIPPLFLASIDSLRIPARVTICIPEKLILIKTIIVYSLCTSVRGASLTFKQQGYLHQGLLPL